MAYSHCTGPEPGQVQETGLGVVGSNILDLYGRVHTGLRQGQKPDLIDFFLNNTNLTFLAFLYKFDIEEFQNQQNKVASSRNRTHNTNHLWITILMSYPLSHLDIC